MFVVYFPEQVKIDLAGVSRVRPRAAILQAWPLTTGLPMGERKDDRLSISEWETRIS